MSPSVIGGGAHALVDVDFYTLGGEQVSFAHAPMWYAERLVVEPVVDGLLVGFH